PRELSRHSLHELRRLGGELHGTGRARRRPLRDHQLDRSAAPDASRSVGGGACRGLGFYEHDLRASAVLCREGKPLHTFPDHALMRILVATDAWHPQVNGVVRTLAMTAEAAKSLGAEVSFLTPQSFRTFALPSYPGLRLALPFGAKIARLIADARPDSIHIATEGPIGLAVRRYCRKHELPFTTSFHTRFPDYVSARLPVRESWIWTALRLFHRGSSAVMVATPALANELRSRGFRNVVLWPRGVDTALFHPRHVDLGFARPVFLCVGRVAIEKNLEAFLDLDLPGTKVIVGDGPARTSLMRS